LRASQPPRGEVERAVGITGRFIVYYRCNGRPVWDVMYEPTEEQTRAALLGVADELGWEVEIERVEPRVLPD
jgi:hypothetical protein